MCPGNTVTSTIEPSAATVAYQWYRSSTKATTGGEKIDGATESTYTITANDANKYIYVEATGIEPYDGMVTAINENAVNTEHNYINGHCSICNSNQPAQLVDGVYEIGNAGQAFWFADFVNSGNPAVNARLTADIDLEGKVWTPIGINYQNYFAGTFDGQGFDISNIYINTTADNQGFIGFATGNVLIKNVEIVSGTITGGNNVGGIVGYYGGLDSTITIESCGNKAAVSGTDYVSGILAYNSYSTGLVNIKNCYNTGDVTATSYAAAICSRVNNSSSKISNTYNSGKITGYNTFSSKSYAFANINSTESFENCYQLEGIEPNTLTGITEFSAQQLLSCEVTYKLQGEATQQSWGQNLSQANSLP